MNKNWICPHCKHDIVITEDNCSENNHDLLIENNDGGKRLSSLFIVCSNEKCKKVSLITNLSGGVINKNGHYKSYLSDITFEKKWNLIPDSEAKTFPNYIPGPLLKDYKEAYLIKNLSPKASATLSRRCLQGIIRDFWGISKTNLFQEINELKDIIDPLIYQAIDATRKIGNIGAHMEKDINSIIDVDPNEAESLIKLIEYLFKDCYIDKHEKEKQLEEIISISKEKDQAKKNK